MADHDLEFVETFSPSTAEIDFLTEKINEESRAQHISSDAYPFAIFLRQKKINCSGKEKDASNATARPSPSPSSSSVSGMESETTHLLRTAASTALEHAKQTKTDCIVGGCNGSIVYGSIYTDQLWMDPNFKGKKLGKLLMEKVHELGRRKGCRFATVGTMDFQGAQPFYERLGYKVEFERGGYDNGGKMTYLRNKLQ